MHPLPPRAEPRAGCCRRLLLRGIAIIAVAGPAAAAVGRDDGSAAAAFVDRLGQRVIDVLRNRELDTASRLDHLTALLDEATDLPLVARLVLGRYWREANEQQRRDYVAAFRALVLKTMADRLGSYGGETYEIQGARVVDERDTLVASKILRPGAGGPIAVDWRVRSDGGRLLLIDIIAEGVSMVVTQRSEAAEIASRSGVAGLIEEMRRRLAATG